MPVNVLLFFSKMYQIYFIVHHNSKSTLLILQNKCEIDLLCFHVRE